MRLHAHTFLLILKGLLLAIFFGCASDEYYRGQSCELGFWKGQKFYPLVHILYERQKSSNNCDLYVHLQRDNLRGQCKANQGDDYGWRIERKNGQWDREKYACAFR